ncbi:MAG TPA: TonB-dependent receptor [Vicinamibacteria bacterium]
MRKRYRKGRPPARVTLAALILVAGVRPGSAQDFFEQGKDYFKSETIEGVSKHAEAPTETPATVTLITRDEIERYGFRTVADVLNFASMGNFSLGDRRYDLAGSRGLFLFEDFNTRILVMLNGHSLNEPWSNFADIGRAMLLPLDLVERIEIVYGPSSLLYGGYSLYGIVNVITRNGSSMPGARVRLTGGSWGTGEAVGSWGASGTYGSDPLMSREWNVLVAAGDYRSDGQDLDLPRVDVGYPVDVTGGTTWGGPQSGTDFERAPFLFLQARRGDFSLLGRAGYRRRGTPFAPYGAMYGTGDQTLRDEKEFVELRWDHALSGGLNVSARGFHDLYHYHEQDPYADAVTYPGQPGYLFDLRLRDHDTGGEVRLTYRRGTHFLTGGGEYRYRTLGQQSSNVFFDGGVGPGSGIRQDAHGRFGVLYAQEEWRPLNQLSLVVGGNWAHTEPGSGKAQPRVAVVYKPRSTLSIKALYGRGFRPPSIFEASYADYQSQIPNPALASEEISSSELSILWKASHRVAAQAYGFRSRLQGLIRGVTVTSPSDVEGGVVGPGGTVGELVGLLQYQSAGDVKSSGVGASARFQSRRWHAYTNLAYASARLSTRGSVGERLSGSPRWLGSGGISFSSRDWTASLAAHYVGREPLDPSRGRAAAAADFVEANLRGLYRTRLVYPVTLHLDVLNLFDGAGTVAASPVYAVPRLPIEGRRVLVGADVRF